MFLFWHFFFSNEPWCGWCWGVVLRRYCPVQHCGLIRDQPPAKGLRNLAFPKILSSHWSSTSDSWVDKIFSACVILSFFPFVAKLEQLGCFIRPSSGSFLASFCQYEFDSLEVSPSIPHGEILQSRLLTISAPKALNFHKGGLVSLLVDVYKLLLLQNGRKVIKILTLFLFFWHFFGCWADFDHLKHGCLLLRARNLFALVFTLNRTCWIWHWRMQNSEANNLYFVGFWFLSSAC